MQHKGILLILAASVLWGTTGTAQALAPEGAQPLAVGALRLVIAGSVLMGAFLLRRRPIASAPDGPLPVRAALLAAVCMATYQVFFFYGVALTGVAVGTMVGIGSAPVLAGLLGFLFRGERPGLPWAAATALAVAGGGLILAAGGEITIDPLGMLLAVGAGGAYATFSLLSKGMLERQPVEKVMAVVFSLGAVMLAPLLLTQDLRWLAGLRGTAVMLHLGVFATALAYILFGQGLRLVPLASAVTLSLAEPLTAGLLGVLLLGERLSLLSGLGIALIFSGLVVLSIWRNAAAAVRPTSAA